MSAMNNRRQRASVPRQKVYVGMSGGVDSSVAAALLKEQGYDVVGVFIKVWQPDWITCTWREDRRDAMRVCARLGIPFQTLDLENAYKKEVVDYMIREYSKGNTPNPDIMCNKHVKFGGFFDWALEQGADYVATGHYARVVSATRTDSLQEQGNPSSEGLYMLKAGIDRNKDQSYFLWTLTQKHLSRTLFPVGSLEKDEVRRLADNFGLSTATKKDSQGICFIGKIDVKDFLSHYIKSIPGDVLDEGGRVIGRHSGALLLTLGERHGFVIDTQTPHSAPYYIVGKDIPKNTITVATRTERMDAEPGVQSGNPSKTSLELSDCNWILGQAPENGRELLARARYRQPLEKIRVDGNTVAFSFHHPYVSSGQSLVVYDDDICLGGGIIGTIRP